MKGVVSVFPDGKKYSRTTRSWDFMGFPQSVERSTLESDIIIGVIDYGIWPESESFRDHNIGPPPSKWKGICQNSNDKNFTCNNKIIGARYFRADGEIPKDDIASPRDTDGHGTHCASTAAGRTVNKASFLGLGQGTARGGVPSARIAVYKPCWVDGCYFADVLAAFDMAILDGVDIISVSLGGFEPKSYLEDPISLGAFCAMRRGILTSASVGNLGPYLQTVENAAPWLLTIGASTIDRTFTTNVLLGNGMGTLVLNAFDLQNKTFPLIYGGDAPDISSNSSSSRFCLLDTLNRTLVKDKIVVCDTLDYGEEPFLAGAAGIIMHDIIQPDDGATSFPLPASFIGDSDAVRILSYIRKSSAPFGTIQKSVQVKDTSAPFVGSFSSRGPHPFSPGILKPDIVAPGVDIVAAWSPVAPVSEVMSDERSAPYFILSGSSMACPHASATAAYIKSFRPTWSEAAIKSAIMTTALPMSSTKNEEAELAYGSGHINPIKAKNPGLVYDIEEDDYINYLCNQGVDQEIITIITGNAKFCQEVNDNINWDLNYPSITIPTSLGSFEAVKTRTVTNVGLAYSTYKAKVSMPEGETMLVEVEPSVLSFDSIGQKLSFTVKVSGSVSMRALMSASLVWDDGHHQVRSPIVVINLA
ncbi:Cucumisin [Bienertia sinuspersici]